MKQRLGNKLRALRRTHDLTQKEVAKQLSIDPSTLSKYENNQRQIPKDILDKFALLYQISPDEFHHDDIQNTTLDQNYLPLARVFIVPNTFIKKGVIGGILISLYVYFFFDTIYLPITATLGGICLLLYGVYHYKFVFAHSVPYQSIPKNTTPTYTLTDQTLYIPKLRFEWRMNLLLSVLSIFFLSMFIIAISDNVFDEIDYIVSSVLIMANIIILFYLFLHSLLKKIFYSYIPLHQVNHTFNTIKYNLLSIIGWSSFIWFMMLLGMLKHLNKIAMFELVMLFILAHFYLFLIVSLVNTIKKFRMLFNIEVA